VFVWTFSPTVLSQGANGLETGLLGLLVAVSLDFYLGSVRESPKPWRLVVMGLLLGLTFLARVDGILLAAAVVFDLLRLPLAPSSPPARRPSDGLALAPGRRWGARRCCGLETCGCSSDLRESARGPGEDLPASPEPAQLFGFRPTPSAPWDSGGFPAIFLRSSSSVPFFQGPLWIGSEKAWHVCADSEDVASSHLSSAFKRFFLPLRSQRRF